MISTTKLAIDGEEQTIGYTKLARTGDIFGAHKIGRIVDKDMAVVYEQNDDGTKSSTEEISNNPDFFSILEPEGSSKIYYMTQFESPRY